MAKRTLEEVRSALAQVTIGSLSSMRPEERMATIALLDQKFKMIAEENKKFRPLQNKLQIRDKDISFTKGAVLSHVDGKYYSNRKDWDNHLKQHNCVEVGNDYKHMVNKSKTEVKGDFTVRGELTKVVNNVLNR